MKKKRKPEKAFHLSVSGLVQGIGFRPYIRRLALDKNLAGWVQNTSGHVAIHIQGPVEAVDSFTEDLPRKAPALADIHSFSKQPVKPGNYTDFDILPSTGSGSSGTVIVPPDLAICDMCLSEINDRKNRRHNYAFTNCTNCGPRYSIIKSIPYDRAETSMKKFAMCSSCLDEYTDMDDRRYHAQPNACPVCGPRLSFLDFKGTRQGGDPIEMTRRALDAGKLVAIKGLGGFHLACNAVLPGPVNRLRNEKARDAKPFAIMTRNLVAARRLAYINSAAAAVMAGHKKPVVLLKQKPGSPIAEDVAPGNPRMGIMLPYTGVHHLLFDGTNYDFLVMTSANRSDEPIAINIDMLLRQCPGMADFILDNNRKIMNRCDDSVVTMSQAVPVLVRRSRGYTPYPFKIKPGKPTVLGCGGELKNSFCLAGEGQALVGPHIGDLKLASTFEFYHKAVPAFCALVGIEPEHVAHDMHPDYHSTLFARQYAHEKRIGCTAVQHHHAHIASAMAENNVPENRKVIGLALDGTGYGTDGTIWGGEFLVCTYAGFTRPAHLRSINMSGGDLAAIETDRAAMSHLYDAFGPDTIDLALPMKKNMTEKRAAMLMMTLENQINCMANSSAGRLFDAASAILGLRLLSSYEAQAAIELEGLACRSRSNSTYDVFLDSGEIDTRPIIRGMVKDILKKRNPALVAMKFHNTMTRACIRQCENIRDNTGISIAVLSGGCFQNELLLTKLKKGLVESGFRVLTHHNVPCNDAGICLGQAAVAMTIAGQK